MNFFGKVGSVMRNWVVPGMIFSGCAAPFVGLGYGILDNSTCRYQVEERVKPNRDLSNFEEFSHGYYWHELEKSGADYAAFELGSNMARDSILEARKHPDMIPQISQKMKDAENMLKEGHILNAYKQGKKSMIEFAENGVGVRRERYLGSNSTYQVTRFIEKCKHFFTPNKIAKVTKFL